MYYWRSLTEEQREEVSSYRRLGKMPKHSLPHFDSERNLDYMVTATCYEHKHIVGASPARMEEFAHDLLKIFHSKCEEVYGWCLLSNHYHVLSRTNQMKELRRELGKLHGRSSFQWNAEDNERGRTVWRNCFERKMRSERHLYASLNYIHYNPVHHGYVSAWTEWSWSSANEYLNTVGRETALQIWREFPVLDYGKGWDID